MQPLKAMAILCVATAMSAVPMLAQQNKNAQPTLWESGNAFLSNCDENGADFAQLSPRDKQTWILVCDVWVQGIAQGIGVTQQYRPEPPAPPPAILKQNKQEAEYLQKMLGPGAAISTPNGNMCIPSDVTSNQLRLVVVQWMKANPTTLGNHGARLVYAALTNTYVCASEKGK